MTANEVPPPHARHGSVEPCPPIGGRRFDPAVAALVRTALTLRGIARTVPLSQYACFKSLRIAVRRPQMIKVSVMYPNSPGARFDHEYYRDKHMPLLKARMGS